MGFSSKEERVHHVFEKIYENYDSMNSVISFKQHTLWRKDVMKRMHVSPGDSALDVCCGTGDWAISLAKAVGADGKVIGLDFSENMLSIAREKGKQEQLDEIEWMHGNAMELPFDDNQFDYVTIGFGLRNVRLYGGFKRNVPGSQTGWDGGLSGNLSAYTDWLQAIILFLFPFYYAAFWKSIC